MNETPKFGLVCAGGGAHGAYQVGVLKYIHEHFSVGQRSPFQIFAGTSCGSLNTSFYASRSFDAHTSRLHLEELWRKFHVPGYHGNMAGIAFQSVFKKRKKRFANRKPPVWSVLDPLPLNEIVHKGFIRSNLEKAFAEKTTLGMAVATTELVTGRTVWFLEGESVKTWNLSHSIGMKTKAVPEHVIASCSVPIFLPPVMIDNRYYVDGSVRLTRPFSSAIGLGASRILSIGSEQPQSTELPVYGPRFKPRLTHVVRMLLNQLTVDTATEEASQIDMLNRFYESLTARGRQVISNRPFFHEDAMPGDYKPIQICLFFPSKRIRQSPVFDRYESGQNSKKSMTRFMFHEKFIGELIDLGYSDAKNKHRDLEQFFQADQKKKWWSIFAGK